jgi:hypothetical protein
MDEADERELCNVQEKSDMQRSGRTGPGMCRSRPVEETSALALVGVAAERICGVPGSQVRPSSSKGARAKSVSDFWRYR